MKHDSDTVWGSPLCTVTQLTKWFFFNFVCLFNSDKHEAQTNKKLYRAQSHASAFQIKTSVLGLNTAVLCVLLCTITLIMTSNVSGLNKPMFCFILGHSTFIQSTQHAKILSFAWMAKYNCLQHCWAHTASRTEVIPHPVCCSSHWARQYLWAFLSLLCKSSKMGTQEKHTQTQNKITFCP